MVHPGGASRAAGRLAETTRGTAGVVDADLSWLAADEPARKALRFERMSKGWAIGTPAFGADLLNEQKEALAAPERRPLDPAAWREQEAQKRLAELVRERAASPRSRSPDTR